MKRRRTPTQDPSTDLSVHAGDRGQPEPQNRRCARRRARQRASSPQNTAPWSLRRALLMPQVNTGSLYRCGKSTQEQPVRRGRRKRRLKSAPKRFSTPSARIESVLGSWGKAIRDAVRNTERWKGAVRLPKILVLNDSKTTLRRLAAATTSRGLPRTRRSRLCSTSTTLGC